MFKVNEQIIIMEEGEPLKAFLEVAKQAQEQRDNRKLQELEGATLGLQQKYDRLAQEHSLMRQRYEEELGELRGENARLESLNKALSLRTHMLQAILQEDQAQASSRLDPQQLAAFRILQQENQQLKALLGQHIADCGLRLPH
jgi:predicted nuclease with TOPRIM domain